MVRPRGTQRFAQSAESLERDLFADRLDESEAFSLALAAHRRRLDDELGEEASPRGRNVLVFHGRGGVGKTELSTRLENWVNGSVIEREHWGAPPAIKVAATARIDLHGTRGNVDPAAELARVRSALGRIKPRWPLFDLAFAAYWAATHPGQALPLIEDEADERIAETSFELLSAVSEDFGSPATLASITVQALRELFGRATDSLRARERLNAPPGFDELFESCATEPTEDSPAPHLLERLAELLAFELDQVGTEVPMVVVFIDTFERLTLDQRRAGERAMNRVIHAMSEVLFVVTGRNRLTWWEFAGPALTYRGPEHWPLLVPGVSEEPRQHALEHLSEKDRRILIALLWSRFALPDRPDLKEAIAEASGGLPEYIRLATRTASSLHGDGIELTESNVAGSFDDLVMVFLAHTPLDEQTAIRAAALLHAADTELIAVAAGVTVGAAERATSTALFRLREVGGIPTPALHDEVRRAIRNASHHVEGGWSEADWAAAGTRALAELNARYLAVRTAYKEAVRTDDHHALDHGREMLRVTAQAIAVTCETDARIGPPQLPVNVDWLLEATTSGTSYAGLTPFLPTTSRTIRGRDTLDFLWAKSSEASRTDRVQILRRLFEAGGRMERVAGRHLAYALRDWGRWDEALEVFDRLLSTAPDNALALRQRVITLTQARRFVQAVEATELAPERSRDYLMASIDRCHGHIDRYLEAADIRIAEMRASETRSVKDTIELEGMRLRYAAFVGKTTAAEINALAEAADAAGHEACRRDCLTAQTLLYAHDDVLEELEVADRARNDGELGMRAAWTRFAVAYAADDQDGLMALHSELVDRPTPRGMGWLPVESGLAAVGMPLPEMAADWREPADEVAARWRDHWHAWHARVVSGRRADDQQ